MTSFKDLRPVPPRPAVVDGDRGRVTSVVPADPATRLRQVLVELGVQDFAVQALTETVLACADVAKASALGHVGHDPADGDHVQRGRVVLDAIQTLSTTTAGVVDSVVVSAASALTQDTAKILLADKGLTSPEELSAPAREAWRRSAKRVTGREIAAASGWGEGEAMDLVGVANTPVSVLSQVHRGLRAGEVTWRLARRFFRETGALATEESAGLAAAFFGDDPSNAVTERLTSKRRLAGGPWAHKEYYRALSREVAKVKAKDPEAGKKSRANNLAGNDVRLALDEHGTGCLMVGTTATQGAAVMERISAAAKAARAAGEPRTLRELRVAVATTLLLHGGLTLDDLPEDPDLVTVEQSEQLRKILHALPTAELNVIVPLSALLGMTPDQITAGQMHAGQASGGRTLPTDAEGQPLPLAFAAAVPPAGDLCLAQAPTGEDCLEPASAREDCLELAPTGEDCSPADAIGVGEVLGAHGMFLTPEEVRALAVTPGSTLYRLVTDPVTGALIERSSTAYAFDGALRAHIIAADVFCRAPGCLKPARLGQIDHVQEYGTPGGHTCAANGQPLDPPHHDLKTKKLWDATLAANRDVTWTTLLRRVYVTKAHDYTQYSRLYQAALTDIDTQITHGEDPAAVIDQAIYQALSYRAPGDTLQAEDDWVHAEDEALISWDQIDLAHTQADGTRTYRAHPEAIRAEHHRHQQTVDNSDTTDDPKTASTSHDETEDTARPTPWTDDPDEPPPF